jgi:Zn-dependent protease with chaperone function
MAADLPETFEASAFHPSLPGGKGPGEIRVDPGWIRFRPLNQPLQTVDMPFDGLGLRLGGASDRILFFSHPSLPEVSIYTSDHRILDHPHLASQAAVAAEVGKVRGRKRNLRLGTAAILGVLVALVVGLVALKGPLINLVVAAIPPEAEVKLGDLVFRQVLLSTTLVPDEDADRQLDALAADLLAVVPDTGYELELYLADDPTLNAFALPGGKMVINSGLILAAETPEEVLGVVSHEIAHVTERHSLRQIVGSVGLFVLVQTLFGDVSGIAAVLADGGADLLTLGFSRDAERDADSVGFGYMLEAEIDPAGMVGIFEKLQHESEKAMGDLAEYEESLSFLSTHPAIGERIESLKQRLAETDTSAMGEFDFDFVAFQDKVRQVISYSGESEDGSTPGEPDPAAAETEADAAAAAADPGSEG